MIDIPLIRGCSADAVFAYRDGPPTGVDEFLRDVAQRGSKLPRQLLDELVAGLAARKGMAS